MSTFRASFTTVTRGLHQQVMEIRSRIFRRWIIRKLIVVLAVQLEIMPSNINNSNCQIKQQLINLLSKLQLTVPMLRINSRKIMTPLLSTKTLPQFSRHRLVAPPLRHLCQTLSIYTFTRPQDSQLAVVAVSKCQPCPLSRIRLTSRNFPQRRRQLLLVKAVEIWGWSLIITISPPPTTAQ